MTTQTDKRPMSMSDRASTPTHAPRQHPTGAGPVGFGQSDMATGYLRSRIVAAVALVLCGAVLGAVWSWASGWVIAAAALLVLLDGIRRLRFGAPGHVLGTLLLDITLTGLAVLCTNLPRVIIVAPLFYDMVSAVFALSRRASISVLIYAALWSLAVISFDLPLTGSALSQTRQEAVVAIAVAVYLAATYLMTTNAATAVRERERLNLDLREKESRLQAVVDSTPIVLYAIDDNGVFTLSEGPGLRLLGLEPGQVVGLNVTDVYSGNPEVLDMVATALASDTDTVHEVTLGSVSFAVRHRPYIDSSGTRRGTVGVAIDVTAAAEYRRQLEEQIRSKDEFVASVSHELRTPLSVVYGLGEELRDNAADLSSAEVDELHTLLAEQAGEVVAIVEDLLVAARADIDRLVVVPESVDVGRQVSSVLQAMASHRHVELTAPAEPVTAWCDGSRSRQILRNLVANAFRHGGESIRLAYSCTGDRVLLELSDNGDGVPPGDEARIFDAYQSSRASTGNPASIGLGLTVARKLARLMDGDLSYERRDGWSVFSLTLPAASAADPG
jgi:PAS domain S-box-containing protein